MFQLRFNQIWIGLLFLAAMGAFLLPVSVGDRVKGLVQNVFAPVARPVRVMGTSVRDRLVRADKLDEGTAGPKSRSDSMLAAENQDLRIQVANLSEQMDALRRMSRDRELLGVVKEFCTPFAVVGGDSGARETLLLETTNGDNVKAGMAAICPTGIVGRISAAGPGGARLQLITDNAFRVQGRFGRFTQDAHYVSLTTPPPLVEGRGKGEMAIRNLTAKDVESAQLQAGDWVIISDPDWPTLLQGYKLGRISEITRRTEAPLFAEIWVKPTSDLMALREVMVVNKK